MEIKKTDPLGILKDGTSLKSEKHYEAGDGWQIVLTGDEITRPKSLVRIAMTRAEITFETEDNFNRFLEIIKESEERMSKIPDNQVMYTWAIVRRKGLTIRFGVSWFDYDFYHERKDAYLSELHNRIFLQFGVTKDSLRIEHIPL